MELDPLGHRLFELEVCDGHLLPGPAVVDLHAFRPQAQGGPRRVHSRVPSPDHGNAGPHRYIPSLLHVPKEAQAVRETGESVHLARDPDVLALLCARSDKHGLVSLSHHVFDREIHVHGRVVSNLHTAPADVFDLVFDDLERESEGRHTDGQHPAAYGKRLEHGGAVTHSCQVEGARESGRSGAHHGNLLRLCAGEGFRSLVAVPEVVVRGESLQGTDGHRIVQFAPAALHFAGVMADSPADGREGVALPYDFHGPVIVSLADGGHVPGNIDPHRAGVLAGGDHQGIAHRCGAALVTNVRLVLVSEMLKR